MAKKGSLGSETKKFYKSLTDSRKDDLKSLVNCPFLEEDVVDILGEAPDKLAKSLQFFLQGIGKLIYFIFFIIKLMNKL